MGAIARWRAALNIHLLNDLMREQALTGIQKVAQQGALMQNPTVAASYAALSTKGTTFTAAVASVTANEKVLQASLGARTVARTTFDLELSNYKTLVENLATSSADIQSMGLVPLVVTRASKVQPDPPGALVVKLGKVHGKARVAVQGKGDLGHFVAEVSTDPIGAATWSPLPGNGKQRQLSGYATGTKLWVHFAAVVWGLQSAWSVPVLVTIP
jgi:hypothetical protein